MRRVTMARDVSARHRLEAVLARRASTAAPSGATTTARTPNRSANPAASRIPEMWLPPISAVVKGTSTVSTTPFSRAPAFDAVASVLVIDPPNCAEAMPIAAATVQLAAIASIRRRGTAPPHRDVRRAALPRGDAVAEPARVDIDPGFSSQNRPGAMSSIARRRWRQAVPPRDAGYSTARTDRFSLHGIWNRRKPYLDLPSRQVINLRLLHSDRRSRRQGLERRGRGDGAGAAGSRSRGAAGREA